MENSQKDCHEGRGNGEGGLLGMVDKKKDDASEDRGEGIGIVVENDGEGQRGTEQCQLFVIADDAPPTRGCVALVCRNDVMFVTRIFTYGQLYRKTDQCHQKPHCGT